MSEETTQAKPEQTTQQEAPQPQQAQKGNEGRMVYGLDGQEPVPEREWRQKVSEDPAFRPERAVKNAVQEQMSKPEAAQEEASYWKEKAQKYQEEYEKISRYGGIISAMENDSNLVEVMQRAIAGEAVEYEDSLKGESLREYGDEEPSEGLGTRGKDPEQLQREAEERGRRQAQFNYELQTVMADMLQNGATEQEVDQFLEFVKQPAGMTAYDLLAVYKGRLTKDQGSTQDTKAPPKKQNIPSPVSTMGGETDRPSADNYQETPQEENLKYYPGNPNNY